MLSGCYVIRSKQSLEQSALCSCQPNITSLTLHFVHNIHVPVDKSNDEMDHELLLKSDDMETEALQNTGKYFLEYEYGLE